MGYPTKRQFCANVNRANLITHGLKLCHYFSENGSALAGDCSGSNAHLQVASTGAAPVSDGSEYGNILRWDTTSNQFMESTEDHTRYGSQGTVYFRMKCVAPVTVVGNIAVAIGGASSGETYDGFLWIVLYTDTGLERLQFAYRDDGGSATSVGFQTDTSDAFSDGVWTDFFITGDGTSYAAYAGGAALSLDPIGGGAYKWLGDLTLTSPVKRVLGMRYRGGLYAYTGEFDIAELRIYDRVLSTAEMRMIREGTG
jgi:hypothetical protein